MQYDFDTVLTPPGLHSYKWGKYPGRDVIPMFVADMDFRTAPAIIEALRQHVDHGVFGYAEAPAALVDAIIERLDTRHGWRIQPDWLVWLPGVVSGLAACCRIAGRPGDEIITNPPIYHHFLHLAQQAGRKLVLAPLKLVEGDTWIYDLEAMESAITPRTRMILMCNPHNPVGRVFDAAELRALVDLCKDRDIVICSDEIHGELILDAGRRHVPTAVASPEYADRMITLLAPSKTFNLSSVNCSFAVIPDRRLRERYTAAKDAVVPRVNALAYTAALAAYRDGDGWHRALIKYLRGNRDYLDARIRDLPGLSMSPVQATYLAWINVAALGVDDPAALFEKFGVGPAAGAEFGDAAYVRLNFACPHRILIDAVDRIERLAREYASTRAR